MPCLNKKRVSAIIGAGVNLSFNVDRKPSTYNLTETLVNYDYTYYDVNTQTEAHSTVVKDIYNLLCKNYSEGELVPDESYHIIHFEIIFHILENLYSYGILWNRKSGNRIVDKYIPPFAYLTTSKISFKNEEISEVMHQFITILMTEINKYDEHFNQEKDKSEKWYADLWNNAPYKWDVFNFNYDTTIESCLPHFEDGFETIYKYNFKQFNPIKLLQSSNHTVNHIHGCILYGQDRFTIADKNTENVYLYGFSDWYCWNNFKTSNDAWISGRSSMQTLQNHESSFPSPIITGLNKTDKITTLPFDIYRYNLNRRLMTNNAIFIAGYSFGDYYINEEIERMRLFHKDKFRAVIVDYWNTGNYTDEEEEIEGIHDYIEGQKVNDNLCYFIEKAMHIPHLDYYAYFKTLRHDRPFVSENKQVMLFIGGIQVACEYKDEIYAFLNS